MNLDRLLNLARKTGNGLIVYDRDEGRHFAIVDINEYERLVEIDGSVENSGDFGADVGELTERELIDKINGDLALWKSRQEESEYQDRGAFLEEEMEDDCFDPFAENCLAEDDWHSAGEILNKYHSTEENNGTDINFLDRFEKNEIKPEEEIRQIPFENHGEVEIATGDRLDGEDPIFFEEPVE
mgnify:FL=1